MMKERREAVFGSAQNGKLSTFAFLATFTSSSIFHHGFHSSYTVPCSTYVFSIHNFSRTPEISESDVLP